MLDVLSYAVVLRIRNQRSNISHFFIIVITISIIISSLKTLVWGAILLYSNSDRRNQYYRAEGGISKILSTINHHNYFIPKMNLKAIVANREGRTASTSLIKSGVAFYWCRSLRSMTSSFGGNQNQWYWFRALGASK